MPDQLTDHDIRLRRLKFRSWHRGIKEMDLILGHFADEILGSLPLEQIDQYESLIEIGDTTLYNWVTGREKPEPEHDTPVFARICEFHHLKGTLWQR